MALENSSQHVKRSMLSAETMRRSVRGHKNRGDPTYFKEPSTLAGIDPADIIRFKIREEPILLHDSGSLDPDRFMIFASTLCLEAFKNCEVLAADQTFEVSIYQRESEIIRFPHYVIPRNFFAQKNQ